MLKLNPAYTPTPIVAKQCDAENIYWGPEILKTVNGVALSPLVISEIRRCLGVSESWLTRGQLEEAMLACAYDCNLIDDPEGETLEDKMALHGVDLSKKARTDTKPAGYYQHLVEDEDTHPNHLYPREFIDHH